MIVPPEAHGVRCISMGFFAEEDQAVIWRGPMLHKALEQFLTDVYWDEPDFLLVDLPPGTGDISISIAQFLPRAEVLRGHHAAAGRPAGRPAGRVHGQEGQPRGHAASSRTCRWFTGDDGKRYELFGAGGGQELADRLEVPAARPDPARRRRCARAATSATRSSSADPDGEAAAAFAAIAERIDVELAPTRRFTTPSSSSC